MSCPNCDGIGGHDCEQAMAEAAYPNHHPVTWKSIR